MADNLHQLQDEIFDKLLEGEKDKHNTDLESFEAYAARTKAQMHQANEDYIKHLMHGYQVIIDKMHKKQPSTVPTMLDPRRLI
jgi:hypothetical protein